MFGCLGRMQTLSSLLFLLVSISLLSSCSDDNDLSFPPAPDVEIGDTARSMTLVYMIAENSLASYAARDINEMTLAASTVPEDCYMLAFVDDAKNPRICRFYNNNGHAECDTVYTFKEDFCSSDTTTMRNVFNLVFTKYPTRSMNLVMWSHGSGWARSKKASMQRIIGIDNEKNSSISNVYNKSIEMEELAALLESLPVKTDLLMFDACLMQNVETAYALRNAAKWILASPAEIPADGAPYDKILPHFFTLPFDENAVKDLMHDYYAEYANLITGVVLSVVSCGEMENFAKETATFIPQYFSRSSEADYRKIFTYLPATSYYPDYYDVNAAMCSSLSSEEYLAWYEALNEVVLFKCASKSWVSSIYNKYFSVNTDYCGLSMYLPQDKSLLQQYNAELATTEWYDAVNWQGAGW